MAKFYTFPSHSMLEHVDEFNKKIDDKEHLMTQGWNQAFSDITAILAGKWIRTAPTKEAKSTCSWTPWSANVFVEFDNSQEYTLKMPKAYKGILQVLTSGLIHKEYILVDGLSFSYTADAGDILQGALSTKK